MTISRTALLGASTLHGKDLLERLGADRSRLGRLMLAESGADVAVATPVLGEWVVSTPLMDEALEDAELVLCCGRLSDEARETVIRVAGQATIIDLAGSFEARPFDAKSGASLASLGPGLHASPKASSLVLAAMARAAARAGAGAPSVAVACEPASEIGQPAVDEILAQAVALLSFQKLPTEVFGRQAVHDVQSPGPLGEGTEARIRREVRDLGGGDMAVLVLQPGLFHGAGLALRVTCAPAAWRKHLSAEPRLAVARAAASSSTPTPASSVDAERAVIVRLVEDGLGGAWAWAVADTLAHGAVGNVVDLIRAS